MRPNVDDYEDIEETKETSGSRAMSWMVLAVAVGGFAALAYYAYNSGGNPPSDAGDVPTVTADATPIKEAPADPQGEQFANKDKTIYDVIANDGQPKVEKLLPDPEKPVIAANVEDSEDTVPVVTPPPAAAPLPSVSTPPPASATSSAPPAAKSASNGATKTTTFVAESEVRKAEGTAVAVAPVPAPPPAPVSLPEPEDRPRIVNATTVNGKPIEVTKATPSAADKAASAAPAEVTKKPTTAKPAASAGGDYRIQLGAYGSEGEAQAAWKKISGKYASLSGEPTIVKADVNGKTFYRLRTGSFATSADAKAACGKLAGQACMAVK
jgi:hypothetical protein